VNLIFIHPRAELRRFIRAIWAFESQVGLPSADVSLAVPNGSPKLIISCSNPIITCVDGASHLRGDQNVYFIGIRDVPVKLHTEPGRNCFIGIEFRPHGAYPIIKIPLIELTNRLLPATELFRDWGLSVTESIANLGSARDRADFVQELLLRRLEEDTGACPALGYCVEAISASDGLVPIPELERKTGYSQRYLEMLFKKHVGVPPKTLAGILRFQRFYRKWARGESYDEIKQEIHSYYYDQAHFAKDFRKKTGFYPQRFVAEVSNAFGRQLCLQ
jgi:AraC-like DNA-binding protein